MKNFQGEIFAILCSLLLSGCALADSNSSYDYSVGIDARKSTSSYDYSASIDCLKEPLAPQYGGGLVANPTFDSGLDGWHAFRSAKIKSSKYNPTFDFSLDGWHAFGSAKIKSSKSKMGNNYIVAYDRSEPTDSFSHVYNLKKDLLYTFSAWFQLNKGKDIVSAFTRAPNGQYVIIGSVIAQSGCWSMLKGGFTADENMKAEIIFMCKNTTVELWMDNVSLKPFTRVEWRDQQQKTIDRVRKRKIRIHVTDKNGVKLKGANITITQTRPHFLIGGGVAENILHNKAYQDYFTSRFTAATFHNEMKWYFTEPVQGKENYTVSDAMVSFFRNKGISIRGHTILWSAIGAVQHWLQNLPPREILYEAVQHVASVVSRYSGDLIAWDVMNENMHNFFYEDKLGPNASAMFYQIVRAMDHHTPLFLNEYNTLEYPADWNVIPSKYVEMIRHIRSFPGNEDMVIRIGLQGHFLLRPNISHIRASFDVLGATKMPIWLTELDTKRGPDQAAQLEDVMREAYSHPAVEGIIVWGGWKPTACNETCLALDKYDILPTHCAEMCLIDNNFKNLPPGDVVDKLIKEWKTTNVTRVTKKNGVFEETVFHGEYSLTYSHPMFPTPVVKKFNVTNDDQAPLDLWVALQ